MVDLPRNLLQCFAFCNIKKISYYLIWSFLAVISAYCFLSCPTEIWQKIFLFLFVFYSFDIRHHIHPQGLLLYSDIAVCWVFPWRMCCKDSDPSFSSSLDFLQRFHNYLKVEKVFKIVLQAIFLFIHSSVLFDFFNNKALFRNGYQW